MSLFQIFRRNVDFLPLFYNQNKILFITNRGTEINFKIFFPVDTYQIICNWFSQFNALAPLIFCNSIWKFKVKNTIIRVARPPIEPEPVQQRWWSSSAVEVIRIYGWSGLWRFTAETTNRASSGTNASAAYPHIPNFT